MKVDNYTSILVKGLSIKPHCAIGYVQNINQQKFSLIPKANKSIGYLSQKAKARMTNSINWMIYLSQKKKFYSKKTKKMHALKLNFITLTLCSKQMHSDKYIVERMLKVFLKWMRRQGNDLYVWRAETQQNGNIHFHITTNRYIHWQSIRNKWNSVLQKHGYLREYIQSGGDDNPNSIDVHAVKNIKFAAAYMVKYMSKKTEGRRDVSCKVWSCSTTLMNRRMTISQLDEGYEMIANNVMRRCEAYQVEHITYFTYPSELFRDGLMDYTDEQLARNETLKK